MNPNNPRGIPIRLSGLRSSQRFLSLFSVDDDTSRFELRIVLGRRNHLQVNRLLAFRLRLCFQSPNEGRFLRHHNRMTLCHMKTELSREPLNIFDWIHDAWFGLSQPDR